MTVPLTVIILTLDEEKNIEGCLQQLDWAEDVVLVDSGSQDRTVDEARKGRPDIRVFTREFTDFGDQRNWALDHTDPQHDWILFMDADERCVPPCAEAIRAAAEDPGDTVGFFLCSRSFYLGKWIRHCTLYPSWQLRLLRKGQVRFRKEGHGQREVTDGPLDYIDEPYDHYGFSKGLEHWLERHSKYAGEEVELILRLQSEALKMSDLWRGPIERRRFLKRLAARVGCRPLLRFVYMYCIRLGFLDGRAGFEFCRLRFNHEMAITTKLAEARKREGAFSKHGTA